MGKDDGACSSSTGLGSAEAPEPPSRLRPAGAIPSAEQRVAELERVIIEERQDHARRYSEAMAEVNRYDLIASSLAWRPLSDITWQDGRDVVLLAYDMEVQARYCAGEWSDDTPISPREYSGAVWSCFDDQFQIEIEETSPLVADWHHGPATHWRELTPRPAQGMSAGTAETPQEAQGEARQPGPKDAP